MNPDSSSNERVGAPRPWPRSRYNGLWKDSMYLIYDRQNHEQYVAISEDAVMDLDENR